MSRYIDAEIALKRFEELHGSESTYLNLYNADWITVFLEGQSTSNVQEVKHGKWEKSLFAQDFFRCSECCAVWNRKFEYCPHCGAKMDGGASK